MNQTLRRWRGVIEVVVAVGLAAIASGGITYGLQFTMATQDPVVVVVSRSMVPTLEVGDLVIIQGVDPGKVTIGEIVVFHSPAAYDEKIIHRVKKIELVDDTIWFTTQGDANWQPIPGVDHFPAENLIGKAVFWFRYLGYPAMALENTVARILLWASFIALVAYNVFQEFPRTRKAEDKEKPTEESTYKDNPEASSIPG